MCRFLAYLGDTIFLDELVCKPQHSLVRQSLRADQAKAVTNGDGFGIGWYGERQTPGVYREVMPAWSDENLLALCANVRSHLFFAHVRAATGTGIARQNCHPFHYGPYLFMHNGQIGGYGQIRRAMEARLPDHLYAQRKGATDSELLFLLIIARMEMGESVPDAVNQVLNETLAMMQVLQIHEPLRFAAALADGEQVHAFRFSSDKRAPTLYMREASEAEGGRGLVVASEPLADEQQGWELIPQGMVLRLGREGFSRLALG
ncbi:class II glutamine amidotransferase [Paucibacter aquatile]|uniref:Class II glutamine amidotransferase n=1 Tax=Kinneretia aquatilis TaxID=2070761 RepID=A0A2N8L0Z3_9BURK|nr:class II glutamine amidotransferase [Paucibacter aquatile]OYU25643.1 MAG: class II glutamine amidotransferase [Burkholderiales bacterium PBB2]PND39356.1 class II glutamine amidotransferase [Paucibacter aquatile]